eukprot:CAMPEP_0172014186 /NCGR_PEP_ID=MMETSP1041-20130122/9794_1 /TAXON_ID=464988 /ORGANISM="Hemiselmis andersenii, Strain CCMP439" /LENGTH=66 /DNA_ID=CAMNT_0012668927 /DNA_START=258 /DNA_END=455 /DNA_ORIENTATION=+
MTAIRRRHQLRLTEREVAESMCRSTSTLLLSSLCCWSILCLTSLPSSCTAPIRACIWTIHSSSVPG